VLFHPKAQEEERHAFQQQLAQQTNKPVVYIDESGFQEEMPRLYGYALRGQRCFGRHTSTYQRRTNVIGALLGKHLLTVSLFENNIDAEVFSIWVKQDLLPKLPSSSILIMDNAAFHKSVEMQAMIRIAGHTLLYLPPYSPDLNPIERKWAQAKSMQRKYECNINELFANYIT